MMALGGADITYFAYINVYVHTQRDDFYEKAKKERKKKWICWTQLPDVFPTLATTSFPSFIQLTPSFFLLLLLFFSARNHRECNKLRDDGVTEISQIQYLKLYFFFFKRRSALSKMAVRSDTHNTSLYISLFFTFTFFFPNSHQQKRRCDVEPYLKSSNARKKGKCPSFLNSFPYHVSLGRRKINDWTRILFVYAQSKFPLPKADSWLDKKK